MSTTLTRTAKPKTKTTMPKQTKLRHLPHVPNYITILPPGELISEKISEMGIDATELAKRMEVPVVTIEKILRHEIPLTKYLAEKLEEATSMPAESMIRYETDYHIDLQYAMIHPEIPAYLGTEIINQPPKKERVTALEAEVFKKHK